MAQPKVYKDNAQKQAAYRRRKGTKPVTKADLAGLAHSLNAVLEDAVEYSAFPLPNELVDARTEVTLRNLIQFFDPIYHHIRNPNGKHHRKPRYLESERTNPDYTTKGNKP